MDKRKLKRRQLIYYLSVFERNTGQLMGQLVDLTIDGMMLTSEQVIEDNITFEFRMVLPDVIEGNNKITFDAQSMWCRKDVNPHFYDIGFRFTRISPKAREIVENLIQDFSFLG